MRYPDLNTFLDAGKAALAKGPVAMIFVEDLVEVSSTIRHHQAQKFRSILVFAPVALTLPPELEEAVHRIDYDMFQAAAVETAVNAVIAAAPGIWMYYCFNTEFLFYPFAETRTIGELLTFHTEERRDAMLTYVIDLYAGDLSDFPMPCRWRIAGWTSLDITRWPGWTRRTTTTPKSGSWIFTAGCDGAMKSMCRRRNARSTGSQFSARGKGWKLRADHTFSDEEYNTYSCPWHHNLTASVCSFRTAKALRANAGSRFDIHTFRWHNSVRLIGTRISCWSWG